MMKKRILDLMKEFIKCLGLSTPEILNKKIFAMQKVPKENKNKMKINSL